jgi:VanZ like protein
MSGKIKVLVPLAYMAGIFLLSSIPDTGAIDDEFSLELLLRWVAPDIQNILHIPLFGGLAWCWYWALQEWTERFRTLIIAPLIISSTFSVFDEIYQLSVPGRFGSLSDVFLNLLGIGLMLSGILLFKRKSRPPV